MQNKFDNYARYATLKWQHMDFENQICKLLEYMLIKNLDQFDALDFYSYVQENAYNERYRHGLKSGPAAILSHLRPEEDKMFNSEVWQPVQDLRNKYFFCPEHQVKNWLKEYNSLRFGNQKSSNLLSIDEPSDRIPISRIKEKRAIKEEKAQTITPQQVQQETPNLESAFDVLFEKSIVSAESPQGVPAVFVQEILNYKTGISPGQISSSFKIA